MPNQYGEVSGLYWMAQVTESRLLRKRAWMTMQQ